jgi:hypothetical protein
LIIAALLSCGRKESRQPSPLSTDELYLVDAYLKVRTAGAFYPNQPHVADSLLARLAGEVDTLRVERTITALNATPERWAFILQTIEDRVSTRDSTSASKAAGR